MKKALISVVLSLAFAACANGKADDTTKPPDPARPVGSSGLAEPAAAAKPAGDPTMAPAAAPNAGNAPAAASDAGATGPAAAPNAPAAAESATAAAKAGDPAPEYREITVPAGTVLPLRLASSVGSDTSNVEDPVRATLRNAIVIRGTQVIPAGTAVSGHVTQADRSARVKGRARVAFRFNQLDMPGDGGRMSIRTGTVSRIAPGTKKQDATKIGAGAAGGAIVGGLLGGGKGAAKGAVIGGGAGTGVVLATRGKEVRLASGSPVSVKLTAPLTVRVRVR